MSLLFENSYCYKAKELKLLLLLSSIFFANTVNSQYTIKHSTPVFETPLNRPERIEKLDDGHYLIDFGKAFWGTIVIRSNQDQDTPLIFHLGEKLTDGNTIDKDPGGTIRYQKVELDKLDSGETLIELLADKRNTGPEAIVLPDSFGVVMPFRYCEIENLQLPIEKIEICQKAFHYKFNDGASFFTSSDTVLNAIWDLCKHTIKATTFAGYYVDGDRERIPYEADAYINQLSHFCLDNEYSIARRTNEYFMDNPTWPTEWLLHTVLLYYQEYMYTGELNVLRKNYDMLKTRTLMDLEREDGLISSKSGKLTPEFKSKLGFKNPKTNVRDIVDWPPGQKDTGWKLATEAGERDGYEMVDVNTVVNSFYYYNLVLMAKIAGFIGKDDDVEFFHQKSEKTKIAINRKLFDKVREIYVDGEGSGHASLHANMFPLAFGLVPEENVETVVRHIKTRGMACSVYGAQYLLEGLFKAGEADYALELITETTHDRTWWNMIKVGSTMTLEAWDMKYKPNADWNHAWGTAPTNIITRYLWGIRPLTPGFKRVLIQPQIVGLNHTEIKVPTKSGSIFARFKKSKDGSVTYHVKLPEDMIGEFVLPDRTQKVRLNNVVLNKAEKKIVVLKPGKNTIEIERL